MMKDENDWRPQSNHESLNGTTRFRRRYQAPSESWDHDHCEFCFAKFMEEPGDQVQPVGYCDASAHSWICDTCFADYQVRFNWTVEPANDERISKAIEAVIADEYPVDPDRFLLTVLSAQVIDWDEHHLSFEAAVHVKFLLAGSPYCCGEPACHLRLFSDRWEKRLSQIITERLQLKRAIDVRLKEQPEYATGVRFSYR